MLLQQFGLSVVRRPAAPGTMELALPRRVCFRKVSSQPGSLWFSPDRCVRSCIAQRNVRGSRVCGHAVRGVCRVVRRRYGASRGSVPRREARASIPIDL